MKKLFLITLAVAVYIAVSNNLGWFTDDSDLNGWHRSGFTVRVDYATGVNYIESSGWFGNSITPRLTTNTKHP